MPNLICLGPRSNSIYLELKPKFLLLKGDASIFVSRLVRDETLFDIFRDDVSPLVLFGHEWNLLEMMFHLNFYWEVTSHLQSQSMGDDALSSLFLRRWCIISSFAWPWMVLYWGWYSILILSWLLLNPRVIDKCIENLRSRTEDALNGW